MKKRFLIYTTGMFLISTTSILGSCLNEDPTHILINKKNAVSREFIPPDLVVPNVSFTFSGFHEKKQLSRIAATALEELFANAKKEGIELYAISGYRSYQRQEQIFANNVKQKGEVEANKVSARPGESEHQSGLVMDVSAKSAGFSLVESFGETKEGKWLAANAYKYGFIIRYPKGKEHITGYIYEPWHIRYVGKELAEYIYTNDLTLEEVSDCELLHQKRKQAKCATFKTTIRIQGEL